MRIWSTGPRPAITTIWCWRRGMPICRSGFRSIIHALLCILPALTRPVIISAMSQLGRKPDPGATGGLSQPFTL
jgi:hypothetical protein